jgi:hypothetical protein
MARARFSSRQKAIIALCCILLALGAVLIAAGYLQEAAEKKQVIRRHLEKAAGRMAGQVNGDGLLTIRPGDEGSPQYLAFAGSLYEGRKNDTFLVTAYLLRVDNGTVRYVVHDAWLTRKADEFVVRTGEPVTEDIAVILNATVAGPVASPDIYTSKWGSYISGYAPVRDSNGTVVGVLGVDETADTVFSYDVYQFYKLVEVS